ncbi:Vicilin-like antimicrobial peptides 2-1 [Bienertia sinuspersici]
MKQGTKFPKAVIFALVTGIILVGLGSMSWASEERKLDMRERCEQECERQELYFEEHLCVKRCLAKETDRGIRHHHMMGVALGHINVADAEKVYERCQESCHGTGQRQWQCQRKCQDEHPKEHDYGECLHKCEDREEGFPRQRQCKLHCEAKFGGHREHHKHGEGEGRQKGYKNNYNSDKSQKVEKSNNPYYFDSKSFESRYSTEEGQMRVLQRFSEKSHLLLGIDRFRVGFYEANPSSFMLPHHWDADSVLFVIKGKATMTLLKKKNRETFNLKRGDVLMIPAGTTTYLISTHKDEKLEIAELLHPVNSPGHYEVPKDQLDKLFKQQKEGAIVKASHDQMRGLAHHGFRSSKDLFNLLDGRPQQFNEHGEFYEVTPDDYQHLKDLDVSVAYCDIKQGSMMAPNYNSRATYVVVVEEGSGYFEMACPHMGNESNKKQQEGNSHKYEKVRSLLSKGDVFVIPAGHPVALVASENESIRAIGFGINAKDNQRNFLAGKDNIMKHLDDEAIELSFNLPAKEVEDMFQIQRRSYFMAGPRPQLNVVLSLLDLSGF